MAILGMQESHELSSFKRKAGQLETEMKYMDEVPSVPPHCYPYTATFVAPSNILHLC